MYCLKEESTHFGLEYQHILVWRYQHGLSLKNHTSKVSIFHNGFEPHQVSRHNFLYKNALIFPLYILLTRRINTLWSKGINTFWYRKSVLFTNILNYLHK